MVAWAYNVYHLWLYYLDNLDNKQERHWQCHLVSKRNFQLKIDLKPSHLDGTSYNIVCVVVYEIMKVRNVWKHEKCEKFEKIKIWTNKKYESIKSMKSWKVWNMWKYKKYESYHNEDTGEEDEKSWTDACSFLRTGCNHDNHDHYLWFIIIMVVYDELLWQYKNWII